MKQVSVKLYEFHELSEDAQQVAINNYRQTNAELESMGWSNDFAASKKAFLAVFGLEGRYTSLPSESDGLTGVRLATYIWNNYADSLQEDRVTYLHAIGSSSNKKRHSKIFKSRCCVLTGVCFDNYFTDGIWAFLKSPSDKELSEVIDDCVSDACKERDQDIEDAYYNDELIHESLMNLQDQYYYEDGNEANIHDYDDAA